MPHRAEILRLAEDNLAAGPVLVHAPPGFGRTSLLAELRTRLAQHGHVLHAAPAEADADVPFQTLADLLDGLPEPVWARLPGPQRTALAQAVRRDHPGPPDRLALRLGLLALLRVLGEVNPVLVLLDDVQWVDPDSADLLAFAARRTGHSAHFVAAERVARGVPGATWLGAVRCLTLDPLSREEATNLLRGQGNPAESAALHEACGGHPGLLVALGRGGGELTEEVRAVLRAQLAGLDRDALLRVALAGRITLARLLATGLAEAPVAAAVSAGVLCRHPDGALAFRLPLAAELVRTEATSERLRAAHQDLAPVTDDPVDRARHLAHAHPEAEEDLAGTLTQAAGSARQRGLPSVAAELGVLAAERTPAGRPKAVLTRQLAAAGDALAAGQHELARTLGTAVLDSPHSTRAQRVGACLVLVDAARHAVPATEPLFRRALAEAGADAALAAPVRLRRAVHAAIGGDYRAAARGLERAVVLAKTARAPATEVYARSSLALCQVLLGDPAAEATLAAAQRTRVPEPAALHGGPGWTAARLHLFADRLPAARFELRQLFEQAEERGEHGEVVAMTWSAVEVLLAEGRCGSALRRAGLALRTAGGDLGPVRYAAALAEAVGGDPARAEELAVAGLATAERDGDVAFTLRNLHALGLARLAAGQAAEAAEPLRRAVALEARMAVADPAVFGVRADLAEALLAVGAQAEAAEVLAHAVEQADRLGRRGVLATLSRAEGIRLLAAQQTDRAVRALEAACAEQLELAQPVQHGRSLLWLGIAERRRRRRAAARDALRLAHQTFTDAGAHPWAARTLAVLGEDSTPEGALTGLEHRIARLVAGGATNREVAARLNVSGKTVEGALTRVYRKLAVRSRTELAARLPDPAHRTRG
ncbi:DNA-binding CsgD family transcriptional regulator [Crossiella equi]|uniref:DNA-binding CsgD family transcriptional regulator n=1 Tax=Crossiella equi TaxID=130796 RepID=A0ABS5AHF1_9PSEU|nr:LuxR family transcriptional regulator [Crossiella equi]MBP2475797.1 DNA-binding CsgD family transcriptional regulator [Crossiella equi]